MCPSSELLNATDLHMLSSLGLLASQAPHGAPEQGGRKSFACSLMLPAAPASGPGCLLCPPVPRPLLQPGCSAPRAWLEAPPLLARCSEELLAGLRPEMPPSCMHCSQTHLMHGASDMLTGWISCATVMKTCSGAYPCKV